MKMSCVPVPSEVILLPSHTDTRAKLRCADLNLKVNVDEEILLILWR